MYKDNSLKRVPCIRFEATRFRADRVPDLIEATLDAASHPKTE